MKAPYKSWRQLLLLYGADFLEWLSTSNARLHKLIEIADHLEFYLKGVLASPEASEKFWISIPDVRSSCNNNELYERPYAAEAYAYVHLLDRYWRTWDALLELTKAGALPVGREGVNVLDVGTGPAPTPYAITDFYGLLRTFAKEQGIPSLADQQVNVGVVERSRAMSYFMHHFSELAQRPGPFGANRPDFSTVNPVEERVAVKETLLRKEYYDATTGEYFPEYLPDEVNDIAQRHERYRLIVLSNFLTLSDSVRKFEPALRNLFSDLGYGAVVIVLGAGGGPYGEIYRDLTAIAEACGMRNLSELPETLGSDSYSEAAQTIKRCQYNVFCHLEQIAGSGRIQRVESYPDYWNPEPSPKKRTEFTLRVYRKGKWPHRATARCGNRQET